MKLVKRLANLGYGSRKEVQRMIRAGMVTDDAGQSLDEDDPIAHERIRWSGAPLDPASPFTLMLHKPEGFTCSLNDPGEVVYNLLPARFARRNPVLSPIGRLDKDTTGLLLMTDDGALLHKIIHPKSECGKVYHAVLDRPLEGHEDALFASGELTLRGETTALLPARLGVLGEREALVTLFEGRYHQVRRMFAASGNHVTGLKRIAIGALRLPDDLLPGDWRPLTAEDLMQVLSPPAGGT